MILKEQKKILSKALELSQDSDQELQLVVQELISIIEKNNFVTEELSRLAAMGEIMDSVAHQWKQPLNSLSMMMELLKMDFKEGSVNDDYIEHLGVDVFRQIAHMVNTLNEFRNFLRPSTKIDTHSLHTLFSQILLLLKDELLSQNITIQVEIDNEALFYGNNNELKHLFLNIINNAIDVFNEREIKKKILIFRCYKEKSFVVIEIEDNAGGIPSQIIENVFDANFTTKENGKGTGVGLFMTKRIVEKNGGTVEVVNKKNGACFIIKLPQPTIS